MNLSDILKLIESGVSLDFQEMSDQDIADLAANYLAFTCAMNEAFDKERARGRCVIYCSCCLEVELLEHPDEKAPPKWAPFQYPPETAYVHKECLAAS